MAIQRTPRVSPYDTRTPFLNPGKKDVGSSGVARPHEKFLQTVQQAINVSPEIVEPPATATSPGQPGQQSFDANWFYQCVGVNIWKRSALNTF